MMASRHKSWNRLIDHAPGLILSAAFFIILFNIGIRLNHPGFDTTDNLLDADNFTWMQRIGWPGGFEFEMRTPHPFAYFIFRPKGYIANLILGDPFYAALFLNSLAGAVCVYLMSFGNDLHKNYASLSAALLRTAPPIVVRVSDRCFSSLTLLDLVTFNSRRLQP
jgi:hypothetical protein